MAPFNVPEVPKALLPVTTLAVVFVQFKSSTIAITDPVPISKPAAPPRSLMEPVTYPKSSKMYESTAVNAPVSFSIPLKLIAVKPLTVNAPAFLPDRFHVVWLSTLISISSPDEFDPTMEVTSSYVPLPLSAPVTTTSKRLLPLLSITENLTGPVSAEASKVAPDFVRAPATVPSWRTRNILFPSSTRVPVSRVSCMTAKLESCPNPKT